MQRVYAPGEEMRRKLKFLYHQGGIDTRYSVIPDYSLPATDWKFYSPTENLEPFPTLEQRMQWFRLHAADLSMQAIGVCLEQFDAQKITHLITVSCTGMSAPGLDLELLEMLNLPATTNRTSLNFIGCYAAIQALKLADAFCRTDDNARVLIVCTELCTLHFQKHPSPDNITSSMLFSDGAAALLVSARDDEPGWKIGNFYSMVSVRGKTDMAWTLSSQGFLMTLSGYIADLVEEDFGQLVNNALSAAGLSESEITHWCIHPGGKRILEAIHRSLGFNDGQLNTCFDVLREYGNMSSPTVLFVLEKIMARSDAGKTEKIFGAAFGPGLTMETFILSS